MADFIPRGDAEAIAHGRNLLLYVSANLAALNLNAGDEDELKDSLDDFELKYNTAVTKKAESESAIVAKDASRQTYESVLRKFNTDMKNVGDAHRAAMNLTVTDTVKTSVGVPTSHPVAEIETSQKLLHIIHFRDEFTPNSKAKPDGVQTAQIWIKIGGAPPIDYKECQYLADDSRTPYNCPFDGADVGKTAYYLLRWINTKGEPGPWSPLAQGTITG